MNRWRRNLGRFGPLVAPRSAKRGQPPTGVLHLWGAFWWKWCPSGRILDPTGGTNWGPKSHVGAKHVIFRCKNTLWNSGLKKHVKRQVFLQKDRWFDMAKCLKNTVNTVFFWYTAFSQLCEKLYKHGPKKYSFLTLNLTLGRPKVDC